MRQSHNNPTGTKSEPKIRAGMRISGLPFPPFFAASYGKKLALELTSSR
jgi:hypothetical protein